MPIPSPRPRCVKTLSVVSSNKPILPAKRGHPHVEGREPKAEDAVPGEDIHGADGRRARADHAADHRKAGGAGRERGSQDAVSGL